MDLTFDDRFLVVFTIDGHAEPAWVGFSYGFFFGIPAVLCLQHRRWLAEHLGAWQYLVVPVGLGFLDIPVEGVSVGWLDLYRFDYRESFLWWDVPWTNIVFIAVTQAALLFLAYRAAELCERAGYATSGPESVTPARSEPGDGGVATMTRTAPSTRTGVWLPAWVALPIAPAAMYLGTFVSALLLEWLDPFAHQL